MLLDAGFREGRLLRVFVGENDRWGTGLLYNAIVERARVEGVAGASVFRGVEGFGSHREIHVNRVFTLRTKMPMLIEIVDTAEKITALLPLIEEMIGEGTITLERVEFRRYLKSERKR